MKATIHTMRIGGRQVLIASERFPQVPELLGKEWIFEFREPKIRDEMIAGRTVMREGLIGPNGETDRDTVAILKGQIFLRMLVTSWNLKASDGEMLPITEDNIENNIPTCVAGSFYYRTQLGGDVTEDEAEALKNVVKPSE